MPFFVVDDKTKIYYEETGKEHLETDDSSWIRFFSFKNQKFY